MKKLNEKGLTLIEVILTFALIMVIIAGILTIIMNYKARITIEMERLDLVTYKNTLTKEIQTDIIDRGLHEINSEGLCTEQASSYSSCINLVFKDGVEKILAVSKLKDSNNTNLIKLLNNKYIKYGDTKYPINDTLPDTIPTGRSPRDFQNIFINDENILTSDSVILADGTTVKIYAIDINMEHIDYEDDFGIHIVATDNDTLSTSTISKDLIYTGDITTYTIPASGTYKIELWGASGGDKNAYKGGLGAYTSGYIYLNKGTILYFYIGGTGVEGTTSGGFNGGSSIAAGQEKYGAPGGGATDVRIKNGTWNDFNSLKSRIMVAAGGGGANNRNIDSQEANTLYGAGNGGAGGGLIGYDGESTGWEAQPNFTIYNAHNYGTGGTQNAGGKLRTYDGQNNFISETITGGFGQIIDSGIIPQSGAGGGWFTGSVSGHGGAGGGSSYISGHAGCLGIREDSTSTQINMKSNSEYSGYYFDNTLMIDGEGYSWKEAKKDKVTMPSYDGKVEAVGNKGNGHARITYLGI